jgi:hypothetical protein
MTTHGARDPVARAHERARERRLGRRMAHHQGGHYGLQLAMLMDQLVEVMQQPSLPAAPPPAPEPPPLRPPTGEQPRPGRPYPVSGDPNIIGEHEVRPLCCPHCNGQLPWALIKGWRN